MSIILIFRAIGLARAAATWLTASKGRLLAWLVPLVPTALALAGVPFGEPLIAPGGALPVLGVLALLAYASYLLALTVATETIGFTRGFRLAIALWLGFGLFTTLLYGLTCLPCAMLPRFF